MRLLNPRPKNLTNKIPLGSVASVGSDVELPSTPIESGAAEIELMKGVSWIRKRRGF